MGTCEVSAMGAHRLPELQIKNTNYQRIKKKVASSDEHTVKDDINYINLTLYHYLGIPVQ